MSSESVAQTPSLRLEKQGAVATLWIDHPTRLNAMSFDMWESIPAFIDDVEADDDIRVVVLRGAGEKAFSSGADISQFGERRSTPEGIKLWNTTVQASVARLGTCAKPVVALIQGICFGGGMGLALHCDLRYALEGSSFSIPAARLGVGYYPSWLSRLTWLVGPAFAKDMMFTARRIDTSEAKASGLINAVVTHAQAQATIERIASMAPLSQRASKVAINETVSAGLYGDEQCEAAVLTCFHSEDYKEGRAAFAEKRPPSFKGR